MTYIVKYPSNVSVEYPEIANPHFAYNIGEANGFYYFVCSEGLAWPVQPEGNGFAIVSDKVEIAQMRKVSAQRYPLTAAEADRYGLPQ